MTPGSEKRSHQFFSLQNQFQICKIFNSLDLCYIYFPSEASPFLSRRDVEDPSRNNGDVAKDGFDERGKSMTASTTEIQDFENQLRAQAHANRNAQENKDELSRQIVARFKALPEYSRANVVMYYIDVRSEVRTRHDLADALSGGKKIVVPYCVDGFLQLFHLTNMDELEVGMYKILEPSRLPPRPSRKRIDPTELDLVMVPGVGFDRRGGRMGHGKGYYDKLLEHVRPDAPLVALAFECQLFPEIPVASHDVFMDKVVTEKAVYEGRGRSGHGG